MCNVKIINQSSHPNPAYQTDLSAGMDLHANIEESISLIPGARILIQDCSLNCPKGTRRKSGREAAWP